MPDYDLAESIVRMLLPGTAAAADNGSLQQIIVIESASARARAMIDAAFKPEYQRGYLAGLEAGANGALRANETVRRLLLEVESHACNENSNPRHLPSPAPCVPGLNKSQAVGDTRLGN